MLARWSDEEANDEAVNHNSVAVVYQDNTFAQLMNTVESLAVVSSESMQHQIFASVVHTFAALFARLPPVQQQRAEDLLLRILPALGDHVLTANLDAALTALVSTLAQAERLKTAAAIRAAHERLRRSVGELRSRANRTE
jgi:hypothetical protein